MSDIQRYLTHEIARANNAVKLTNKLLAIANIELIPYRKGDKWGYCTPNKRIVISCIYEEVTLFYEDIAAVKLNNKWGFINKQGHIVISFIYDDLEFNDGLFKVLTNNKWGILDKKGEELIQFIYDSIYFNNYQIDLYKNGKWIYVNRNNKPIDVESKKPTENKFRVVKNNDKRGVEDKNGNIVIPFIYDYIEYLPCIWRPDLVIVKNDNKYGIIDTKGNVILSCSYTFNQIDNGVSFLLDINKGNDLYPIKLSGRLGYADKTGSIIIHCIYDLDGFHRLIPDEFVISDEDKETIRFIELFCYDKTDRFIYGNFIIVKKSGKRGLIDRQGNTIIPCKYDELRFYSKQKGFPYNILRVYLNKKEGYVSMDGIEYWED